MIAAQILHRQLEFFDSLRSSKLIIRHVGLVCRSIWMSLFDHPPIEGKQRPLIAPEARGNAVEFGIQPDAQQRFHRLGSPIELLPCSLHKPSIKTHAVKPTIVVLRANRAPPPRQPYRSTCAPARSPVPPEMSLPHEAVCLLFRTAPRPPGSYS